VSEFLCAAYGQFYGFDAVIARLFAFVGPLLPLDENYAVGNFIADALHRRPIKIAGDGRPYRSYLYSADLAIWLWSILLRGARGAVYNVGSPNEISIAELAKLVAPDGGVEVAGTPIPGTPAPRYVPCTRRAETELGLRGWIPVEQGITRTLEWHRRSN
jgi:dTDP-glucose 4,6-dehydratase